MMPEGVRKKHSKIVPIIFSVFFSVTCVYFGHLAFTEYSSYRDSELANKRVQDMAQGDGFPQELDENGRPHVDESLLPDHDLISDADENDYNIDAPYDVDSPSLDWYMSMQLNVSELQSVNPDVLCWIYIPDTPINYPVMQESWSESLNSSRTDYLYGDINKSYSVEGSLFVRAFSPVLLENELLVNKNGHMTIFGHNMKNGSMFSSLIDYKDEKFFEKNPYVYLFYPDRTERWIIWTASHIMTSNYDAAPVYTTYLELGSDEYEECINSLYDGRYYDTWVTGVNKHTRTLSLSTCDSLNGNAGSRVVVTAVKDKTLIWKEVGDNNGTANRKTNRKT